MVEGLRLRRVRKNEGLLLLSDPEYDKFARIPTLTCNHCNRVVILNPGRRRDRAYCRRCHAYICDTCGVVDECTQTEKLLELIVEHPELGVYLGRGSDGKLGFDPDVLRKKVF